MLSRLTTFVDVDLVVGVGPNQPDIAPRVTDAHAKLGTINRNNVIVIADVVPGIEETFVDTLVDVTNLVAAVPWRNKTEVSLTGIDRGRLRQSNNESHRTGIVSQYSTNRPDELREEVITISEQDKRTDRVVCLYNLECLTCISDGGFAELLSDNRGRTDLLCRSRSSGIFPVQTGFIDLLVDVRAATNRDSPVVELTIHISQPVEHILVVVRMLFFLNGINAFPVLIVLGVVSSVLVLKSRERSFAGERLENFGQTSPGTFNRLFLDDLNPGSTGSSRGCSVGNVDSPSAIDGRIILVRIANENESCNLRQSITLSYGVDLNDMLGCIRTFAADNVVHVTVAAVLHTCNR